MNTKKMWLFYSLAWLGYALLISLALLVEQRSVSVQLSLFARNLFFVLPAPLLLALLWPCSGWLNQRGFSTPVKVAFHLPGALLFTFAIQLFYYLCFLAGLIGPSAVNRNQAFWPMIYNVMMYAAHALIFHSLRAHQYRIQQDLKLAQTEKLLISTELNALRNKLNPHFLFNTLHSIIALVRKDQQAAEVALFRFSDMLRYILDTEKSGQDKVSLDQELAFIRDYLDLEALRLGKRLQVEWQIEAGSLSASIPALCLQPLVENSIKYAFNPRSQPGVLTLIASSQRHPGQLYLSVSDDGPGCDPAVIHNTTGMGLATIRRRLELEYGELAQFSLLSQPGQGTQIELRLPLA